MNLKETWSNILFFFTASKTEKEIKKHLHEGYDVVPRLDDSEVKG